jgi:hypothetical protein
MKSVQTTIVNHEPIYGSFAERAVIVQALKRVMFATPGWQRLAPDMKQALEMIADKQARILNGDPAYHDNWHDIAGYSTLVADRLLEDMDKAMSGDAVEQCFTPPSR